MARADEIREAALAADGDLYSVQCGYFIKGANWADEHPAKQTLIIDRFTPWISTKEKMPKVEEMVIGFDGWYIYPACYSGYNDNWRNTTWANVRNGCPTFIHNPLDEDARVTNKEEQP